MATNADRFLSLYREFETLLRDDGKDYKELEESANDLLQNRLRINRQLRNYLTHNHDAGFLEISDKQIAFMEKLIFEQKSSMDILKKYIKSAKVAGCLCTDTLDDVLTKMMKLKVTRLPVYDESCVLGIVSWIDVLKAYRTEKRPKTAKLSVVKKFDKKVICMTPDTLMSDILMTVDLSDMVCCTDSGDKKGKFLGVFFND